MPAGADPLLDALVWLTRHHGRERSAASLTAELPASERLAPHEAPRLLHDAGFEAAWVARPLAEIHPLLLPAVLRLADGGACIATRRHEDGDYDIVLPGAGDTVRRCPAGELEGRYAGEALVAAPAIASADTPGSPLADGLGAGHWLWGTLRRFVPYYRGALVAALLSNVLMMVGGLVTSVIYDKVLPHQAYVTLWALAAGAALALGFDLLARQLRSHLIDVAGRKADLLIGSRMLRQTLAVRMEHRPASAGSYAHHLAQIEIVRDFFASATLSALSDLPFVVLFVGMTFVIGGPLGWVLVGAIPLILGIAALIQGALRRTMRANMAQQAELQGILVETVEGLEDLKAAGAQGRFLQRFEESTALAAATALRARALSSWTNNVSSVAQQAVTLVMLVWGVYLIGDGKVTAGALIGAVMFAGRAIAPLGSVVALATRYQGARAALAALNRLMALPTERDCGRRYVPAPRIGGRIAMHDLAFTYPSDGPGPAPRVLHRINLRIEAGERIAILGRIGSGKSTVLRLLAGLYQPTEGRVEVDGLDLRQIDPADFRRAVGFVSQEPRLFHGTLRENVTMGRGALTPEALAEVARITGLDRVAAAHPLGWDRPVGEGGTLLSGGQRQLVALARCLVTAPAIVLMDEPTSSMDAQSETHFLRRLHEAAGDRTLVMVTHRPAVLELAQRLVVVDAGQVVMDGPKAAVLAALGGARTPAAPAASAPPPAIAETESA